MYRFTSHKRLYIVSIALAVVLVGLLLWRLLPPSERSMRLSAVVVKQVSVYHLQVDGRRVLAFAPDTTYTPGVWVNRWMLLPSCLGRVATTLYVRPDSLSALSSQQVARWLEVRVHELDSIQQGLRRQTRELHYYLRVHGVQDEGYNEIARRAQAIVEKSDSLDSLRTILTQIKPTAALKITLEKHYQVIYKHFHKTLTTTAQVDNQPTEDGYLRLRVRSRRKPLPVRALSLWPWNHAIRRTIYLNLYGEQGFRATLHPVITPRFAVVKMPEDAQVPAHYTGFWITEADNHPTYAGYFVDGKRQGRGHVTDAQGRAIDGLFRADTLYYGTRTSPHLSYRGEMNRHGTAFGHGRALDDNGVYYEGHWKGDLRSGFGFAIGPHTYLRAGEWKADIYRGERLTYNSERIYGIDISRFQHDIGSHVYPIDWTRLAITHLGNISQKRVSGKVDYKVSFIYIKSTEGITVRNKYYADDYRQARKHGYRVGSYHFFSTTSDAKLQARHFLKCSSFQRGDFPPVLDVEPLPSQIRKMGGPEELWRRVRTWLTTVESRVGVRPVLYISQSFVNHYLPYAPDIKRDYPVWIARYGEYKPGVRLVYWQFSPDGRVSGIHGDVDINVFNGYQAEFYHFLQTARIR